MVETGYHHSRFGLCTTSKLQLSSRPAGVILDRSQAGTRSGALDAQVQVAQCLLPSGGVRRLRVRNQAKALHRAPDHCRKQARSFRTWLHRPGPFAAVGEVTLLYSIL
jgi:hypothetical protein